MKIAEIIGLLASSGLLGYAGSFLHTRSEKRKLKADVKKAEAEADTTEIENLVSIIQIYKNAASFSSDQLEEAKKVITESISHIKELTEQIDILKIHNGQLKTLIQEMTQDTIEYVKEQAAKLK